MSKAELSETIAKIPKAFIAIFLVVFGLQLTIWMLGAGYIDEKLWLDVAVLISKGTFPEFTTPTPVHPGTALLLPAALVMQLPIDPRLAFHIGLSILMTLAITLSAYIAYVLRPERLWWLCILVLLAPNTIFPFATAPSALASVLAVLFVLLLLLARERISENTPLACIGACAGVLMATRIDTGIYFSALTFPYVLSVFGRRIWIVLAFGALFFAALDPYIYIGLVDHVREFYLQVNHNRQVTNVFDFSKWSLFLPLLGFLFAFVYVYLRPRLTSVPKDFLLLLLALSEILGALLMLSHYHPMRYFLPLMCIWEVFLALFALEYARQESSFKKLSFNPEYVVVAFFILARGFRAAIILATAFAGLNFQDYLIESAASVMRLTPFL